MTITFKNGKSEQEETPLTLLSSIAARRFEEVKTGPTGRGVWGKGHSGTTSGTRRDWDRVRVSTIQISDDRDQNFEISNFKLRTPTLRTPNSRGVALIMVLWVIAILSVIVLEFSFAMRTEVNITQHYKEEIQLYAYAEGGIQRAIAELIYKNDPKIQQMRRPRRRRRFPRIKRNGSRMGGLMSFLTIRGPVRSV